MEHTESHADLTKSTDFILPSSNLCDENNNQKSSLLSSCAPFVTLRRTSSTPRPAVRFVNMQSGNLLSAPGGHNTWSGIEPAEGDSLRRNKRTRKPIVNQTDMLIQELSHPVNRPNLLVNSYLDSKYSQKCASPENLCPPSPSTLQTLFHDPLIDAIDAELPIPPPPPRALPLWLKLSLKRQQDERIRTNSHWKATPISHSLTPPTTPVFDFDTMNRRTSRSLGHDDVRICPIMQHGVKMSDTHYWLLQPPRSRGNCHKSSGMRRLQSERLAPSASAEFEPGRQYLNLPNSVNLRRGLSDSQENTWSVIHREKVRRLLAEVPAASEAECQAILIGSGYNYEEAVKKLKLELLYRQGYVSRSRCRRLLCKTQWNLEEASLTARKEYEAQEIEKFQPSKCEIRRFLQPVDMVSDEDVNSPGLARNQAFTFDDGSSNHEAINPE